MPLPSMTTIQKEASVGSLLQPHSGRSWAASGGNPAPNLRQHAVHSSIFCFCAKKEMSSYLSYARMLAGSMGQTKFELIDCVAINSKVGRKPSGIGRGIGNELLGQVVLDNVHLCVCVCVHACCDARHT